MLDVDATRCSTSSAADDGSCSVLVLRRGVVVEAGPARRPEQRLVVDVDGERARRAIADVGLVGAVAGRRRGRRQRAGAPTSALGSGGFDVVHVNLTRGLDGDGHRRART